MAVEIGTAFVNIVPSARGIGQNVGKELGAPLERAGRDAGDRTSKAFGGRFSAGIRSVARIATGVLVASAARAGLRALGTQFKSLVSEAREAGKVSRLTNQVIRSTGGIANITADGVEKLATRLSEKAGVDDELIQSGANVLATFTNVRNEIGDGNQIFDRATHAALNMSAALGQDMQSSVIQLGKALNNPIKGLTSLQRVGVAFTDSQKEQIKTLVESGDVLGAQKIILKELGTEFGGAAEAAADPLDRLKVIIGNVKEQLGTALLPTLNLVATQLSTALPAIATAFQPLLTSVLPPLISAIAAVFTSLTPFLKELATTVGAVLGALAPVFKGLAPIIGEIGSSLLLVVKAVLPLVPAFGKLVTAVAPLGVALGTVILKAVQALVPIITPLINTLARLATEFIGDAEKSGPLVAIILQIGDAFAFLAKLLLPVLPLIAQLATDLITGLAPVLPELAKAFGELFVALAPLVPELVKLAITLIETIGVPAIVAIATAFAALATAITPLARQTSILTPLIAGLGGAFFAVRGVQALQRGLLGVATAGGKAFGTFQRHQETFSRGIQALQRGLLRLATASGKAFGTLQHHSATVLEFGKNSLKAAANIAKQTAAFVAQKVAQAASAVATKVLAAAQLLLNVVMSANPIVLVVAAIAALALGIFLAYQKFKPFRDIVDAVGRALAAAAEFIVGAAMTAFNWIKDHWPLILTILTGPIGLAVAFIIKNWNKILGAAKVIFSAIAAVVGLYINTIRTVITTAWNVLRVATTVAWNVIKLAVLTPFNAIRDGITGAIDVLKVVWEGFWNGLHTVVKTAVGLVKAPINALLSAIQAVYDGFKSLWNAIEVEVPGFDPPGPGPKFGGFTLDLPDLPDLNIPRLAKGAVVSEETLAIIGEVPNQREIVAPEALLRSIVRDELAEGRDRKVADQIVFNHIKDPNDAVQQLTWAQRTGGR